MNVQFSSPYPTLLASARKLRTPFRTSRAAGLANRFLGTLRPRRRLSRGAEHSAQAALRAQGRKVCVAYRVGAQLRIEANRHVEN